MVIQLFKILCHYECFKELHKLKFKKEKKKLNFGLKPEIAKS